MRTGESQACQVTCSSVKKWKTRPQQVGEGNAPNELISGSNAQSAEAIHQCDSKATSGKGSRSQTVVGLSQAYHSTSERRAKHCIEATGRGV